MTLEIVSRQAWGALPPKENLPTLAYPVADVFLHHEAGSLIPDGFTPAQECERMREIQTFSMNERGYSDFPYGVAVFPSGRAYEGRDLGFVCGGQTSEEAATLNNNGTSVAIVWPGNYDTMQPTSACLDATADVVQLAQLAGVVTASPSIRGHRDVYATDCPGANAYTALPAIRALVAAPPAPSPAVTALQAIAADLASFTTKVAVQGEKSGRITLLRTLLRSHGFPTLPVTDDYDLEVTHAVNRFKQAHGLGAGQGNRCGKACIAALLVPAHS